MKHNSNDYYGGLSTKSLIGMALQNWDTKDGDHSGLGQITELRALPFILPYAHHNNFKLRLNVSMILGDYPVQESAETLMLLALDKEYIVRDWATFSLSNLHTADGQYMDTPEIRGCLWKNVQDADPYVQGEAILGLIYRHDQKIIPVLEQLLSQVSLYEEHATLFFDAATESEDPLLLPALSHLWKQVDAEKKERFDWWSDRLLEAINACSAASS